MPSIFDLCVTPYEPDILDAELRRRVWLCNTNGHLASELPNRGREPLTSAGSPPSLSELIKTGEVSG